MFYGNRRDFIRAQDAIAKALKNVKTKPEAFQSELIIILGNVKPKQTNRQWLLGLSNKDFTYAVFDKIYEFENDMRNYEEVLEPYQVEVITQIDFENWLDEPYEEKNHEF